MRKALLATATLLVALASAARAQTDSVEYAIKATYLYKFAPFVEWPTGAFAAATSPLVVCVVGTDPFGPLLDRAVAGQPAGQRPIQILRLETVSAASGCHIAYLGGSPGQSVAHALAALRGRPVLTVTDRDRNPGAAGIIQFMLHENRVRFEIDDRLAAEAGLGISSKVLNLALRVRPRS